MIQNTSTEGVINAPKQIVANIQRNGSKNYENPLYGNATNSKKSQCVKMEESVEPACAKFQPIEQGKYGICWYASALHSILMSEKIREVLVRNIAQMVINYINPEDKLSVLQEVFPSNMIGGGLCFGINEYYTGTMRRFVKHLLIIFFYHLMSEEDKKNLKLDTKKECEWLYDFAKNSIFAKDKNLQREHQLYLDAISSKKSHLSNILQQRLNNKVAGDKFEIELWKYTDTPSMFRAIADKGGKSHFVIFPFLLNMFNFKECLPIHIPKHLIKTKQELDDVLDEIWDFINTDYLNAGFPKPKIVSITCVINTSMSFVPEVIAYNNSSAFKSSSTQEKTPNTPKIKEFISEIMGDYTLESANLYVENNRGGHVITGLKCGDDKYIYNSWEGKKNDNIFGKGTKEKRNWLDTTVGIEDFYRHTLHTLNFVSTDESIVKYAQVEKDLYQLWKNYEIGVDVMNGGGSIKKMTKNEREYFKNELKKKTKYYINKYT